MPWTTAFQNGMTRALFNSVLVYEQRINPHSATDRANFTATAIAVKAAADAADTHPTAPDGTTLAQRLAAIEAALNA